MSLPAAPTQNATRHWMSVGPTALLVLATLGEGGGSPTGLLVWHGLLVLLLVLAILRAPRSSSAGAGAEPPIVFPAGVAAGWALFLVLCTVGAARAPYAYGAILVLLELAAGTAVAYLASIAGGDLLRRIVTPLGVMGALQGLLAIYQAAATEYRPAGTFLVPNHLALWLVAVLLLLVARAAEGNRTERLQGWVLGAPILAGIVTSGSRGAVLGLAAGGAWLFLVSLRRLSRRQRVVMGAVAALLVLLLGVGLLLRMRGHDPFRYQRVRIWSASVSGFLADPLWGSGPGQFEAAAANQRFPDGDGPLRYDRAHKATHSDWLRLPAEFGAPAALVLLGTAILALVAILRRRREGSLPPCSDGALAASIALCTHAVVDNPSRWPAVYLLAAVLWGALLVGRGESSVESSSNGDARGAGMLARAALAAGLLLLFLVADVASFLAWREITGLPRGRLNQREFARLEKALVLNRVHPDYWMRLAEHLATAPPSAEGYAGAREAAEHALRLQPADARYRRGLARLEARACIELFRTEACRERVRGEFLRAEALSRYDPATPVELAVFLLDLGDPLGARRAAERAFSLEPESVLPRLILADALLASDPATGVSRAAELLREAEAKAEQWAGAAVEPQMRPLLDLDREQFSRLQREIERLSSPGAAIGESR